MNLFFSIDAVTEWSDSGNAGLSLRKALQEMHRERRWYSSMIIRPHQLAYGFVNLKLAK